MRKSSKSIELAQQSGGCVIITWYAAFAKTPPSANFVKRTPRGAFENQRENCTARMEESTTNIVLLGDELVGKSSMAFCYWLGKWPRGKEDENYNFDHYIPKLVNEEQMSREMPETHAQLCIIDTSGGADTGRAIPLQYPKAHAFIIAYAIDRCVGVLCMDCAVLILSRAF